MNALQLSSWEALLILLRTSNPGPPIDGRVGQTEDSIWVAANPLDPTWFEHGTLLPLPKNGRTISSWAEALPLSREVTPTESGRLLLRVPSERLLDLAAEMLRLGCDRQQWLRVRDVGYLQVTSPPWYSVLSALDAHDASVFRPGPPGVWIRWGHTHPLLNQIAPAAGQEVLVDHTWAQVPTEGWTDLYEQIDLSPVDHVQISPAKLPRLAVPLRLQPSARTRPPSLWLLPDGATKLEPWLATLPEGSIDSLLFAATDDLVIVKSRPGIDDVLDVPGTPYISFAEVPNLYRPVGTILEPPLRRDRLIERLAPEPYAIAWIEEEGTELSVHHVQEGSFQPLSEWVDWVIDRHVDGLTPWLRSATFAFDRWVDAGIEWSDARPKTARPAAAKRAVAPTPPPQETPPAQTVVPRKKRKRIEPRPPIVVEDTEREALLEAAMATQASLRERPAPADDSASVPLWDQLALQERSLGNDEQATLAWAHAAFTSPTSDRLRQWAADELGACGTTFAAIESELAEQPTDGQIRAFAACLAAGVAPERPESLPVFRTHLDRLDIRTAWLAQHPRTVDDPLAGSVLKDASLARMREGLSTERDVPAFIRSLDAQADLQTAKHLDAQHAHFHETKRKRKVMEAPTELTMAYVDLVFAWGYASIGQRERALQLSASASQLDRTDRVHDALVGLYEARIQQALAGKPRGSAVPAEASARLVGLTDFQRYQVDRLRLFSGILEVQEHLDPYESFARSRSDIEDTGLDVLRGQTDGALLATGLRAALDRLHGHDEPWRVIDSALDFLPQLPTRVALELAERCMEPVSSFAPLQRVRLLIDAIVVLGHFGQHDAVRQRTRQVLDAALELPPEALGEVAERVAFLLRSLGRMGLAETVRELLEALDDHLPDAPHDSPITLTRATVVGGLLAARTEDSVERLDTLMAMFKKPLKVPARLRLTRALGLALAAAPRAIAIERLPALAAFLPEISDSFNTNSHFCLSVVAYAESMVLGYADTDVSRAARTWIDASEFRVRERVHG